VKRSSVIFRENLLSLLPPFVAYRQTGAFSQLHELAANHTLTYSMSSALRAKVTWFARI